jgi:D-tyrosyl-tRNA(Tyr) deacylase
MRAVVQRVSSARVEVNKEIVGEISTGLLVLLGVEKGDGEADLNYLVDKVSGLRIFEDEAGKMNLSVAAATDTGGEVLVVSQFTLLGDVRKGKRPAFTSAEDPEIAKATYLEFVDRLKALGLGVETGVFAADMQVHLVNDGPVTILLDSRKKL